MIWWLYLSLVGNVTFTGPIGIAIAVWLLAGQSWRLTLSWCMLFCGGMALVVATKVAFYGWGIGIEAVDFAGFSGHSMRAAAVFPVAFFLIFRSHPLLRQVALAIGIVLAILVAISRVKLGAHSASEAVTGCLLGLTVAGLFVWQVSTEGHLALSRILVALCMPVLLILPQEGRHVPLVPTESWIAQLAVFLSGHERPFTRQDWHKPKSGAGAFSLVGPV